MHQTARCRSGRVKTRARQHNTYRPAHTGSQAIRRARVSPLSLYYSATHYSPPVPVRPAVQCSVYSLEYSVECPGRTTPPFFTSTSSLSVYFLSLFLSLSSTYSSLQSILLSCSSPLPSHSIHSIFPSLPLLSIDFLLISPCEARYLPPTVYTPRISP